MEVEAIVDIRATTPVVGPKIAKCMGVWRRAKKIHIKQGDSLNMKGGKFVVNLRFSFLDKPGEYPLDAKVFDIGHRNMIRKCGVAIAMCQYFQLGSALCHGVASKALRVKASLTVQMSCHLQRFRSACI